MKDCIQSQIVADINNQIGDPYYGISVGEVTDCSNWEQLGIVMPYVKDSLAVEKLTQHVNPFMHNVVKWANIKYVWSFYNIIMKGLSAII